MEGNKNLGEIVIFNNEDGEVKVQIDAVNETIWLNQKGMAELFGVDVRTTNYHLGQIYETGELAKEATIQKIWIVQKEGNRIMSPVRCLFTILTQSSPSATV